MFTLTLHAFLLLEGMHACGLPLIHFSFYFRSVSPDSVLFYVHVAYRIEIS